MMQQNSVPLYSHAGILLLSLYTVSEMSEILCPAAKEMRAFNHVT